MTIEIDERHHPDLAEAVRRLVEEFQPDRIYLFGSRARGEAGEDSDYDLLIVVPDSNEPHYIRVERAYEILAGLRLPIEVLVFTREQFDRQAPVVASLSATAIREGHVLYAA